MPSYVASLAPPRVPSGTCRKSRSRRLPERGPAVTAETSGRDQPAGRAEASFQRSILLHGQGKRLAKVANRPGGRSSHGHGDRAVKSRPRCQCRPWQVPRHGDQRHDAGIHQQVADSRGRYHREPSQNRGRSYLRDPQPGLHPGPRRCRSCRHCGVHSGYEPVHHRTTHTATAATRSTHITRTVTEPTPGSSSHRNRPTRRARRPRAARRPRPRAARRPRPRAARRPRPRAARRPRPRERRRPRPRAARPTETPSSSPTETPSSSPTETRLRHSAILQDRLAFGVGLGIGVGIGIGIHVGVQRT